MFFGGDKLERALLHRVILKEGLVDDADALRQVNLGVKLREIARRNHGIAGLADLGANIRSERLGLPLGLTVLR